MAGSLRVGVEWSQDSIKLNKAAEQGEAALSMKVYSKQSLKMEPVFALDQLLDFIMIFDLQEFAIQYVQTIKYSTFSQILCMDIYTEIEEYQFIVQLFKLAFIQCYKVIIDCFFDFGQWSINDNFDSQKPFSPYTKIVDKCEMGNSQPWSVKQYKPLKMPDKVTDDNTRVQYWVGSGNFDEACWPGNLLLWLIDADHIVNTLASSKVNAPGPQYTEQELDTKSYLYSVAEPYYTDFMVGLIDTLKGIVKGQGYEEDKHHVIIDTNVADHLPESQTGFSG